MKNSPAFQNAVDRFISEMSTSSMMTLVAQSRSESLTDSDIAYLANSSAKADGLIWDQMTDAADIASTGGPTSLTTLLCPLYLRSFGFKVPKLGVPGRPAGGIDVLAQIPDFKFRLTRSEADDALGRAGYVHFLAGDQQAHHDSLLFDFRKKVSALDIPALVIASLLTKKLVVGLSRVGLDVRVAPFGNFGRTWDQAKDNARRFCRVADRVGIAATCFLTDASAPYQPYIGRGESLVAISKVLEDNRCAELESHLDLCYAIARSTAETDVERPGRERLGMSFADNLSAQGASMRAFEEKVEATLASHQYILTASTNGFVDVEIGGLRNILVSTQELFVSKSLPFPDPVGVILKASSGSYVRNGDAIATVRAPRSVWPEIHNKLRQIIKTNPVPKTTRSFEEVR